MRYLYEQIGTLNVVYHAINNCKQQNPAQNHQIKRQIMIYPEELDTFD